jgi:adenosylmethionine-8-amino-7-oxononanoate aminotransferase
MWAVEFVADKESKKPFPPEQGFSTQIAQAARQRGLLVYPMQGSVDGIAGDHILIAPPAVISEEQIRWSVDQLRSAIATSLS